MKRMPVLFVGHGSPMNALGQNDYTRALARLGAALGAPKAVLVVSAHWQTRGVRVLEVEKPRTIHDFGGFPAALFAVDYPAPGAPAVAARAAELLKAEGAVLDRAWGLDHGAWAVLRHMWPKADVPVLQLSLDAGRTPAGHYKLGRALAPLRDEGVLILGRGNVTHNLRDFDHDEDAPPRTWAVEFDALVRAALVAGDHQALIAPDPKRAALWRMALPTTEHFLPLLYAMGASGPGDALSFPYEGLQNGTLSMRSVQFGAG